MTPSLFIGDKNSSIDANFIQANKITAVINTAHLTLKNIFAQGEFDSNPLIKQYLASKPQAASLVGKLEYLNLQWQDLQEPKDAIQESKLIYNFIESAEKRHEAVIILSERGQCRCMIAAMLYFARKFGWSIDRSFEFLWFQKPDLRITENMLNSLRDTSIYFDKLTNTAEMRKVT